MPINSKAGPFFLLLGRFSLHRPDCILLVSLPGGIGAIGCWYTCLSISPFGPTPRGKVTKQCFFWVSLPCPRIISQLLCETATFAIACRTVLWSLSQLCPIHKNNGSGLSLLNAWLAQSSITTSRRARHHRRQTDDMSLQILDIIRCNIISNLGT
ncbi:hypothetical protein F5Y14DRAFT_412301 [Nemania sp. NC0429]|nr:hypothetical protein F5Y14DRAFT_412301 [Nemania sp. NC0429]